MRRARDVAYCRMDCRLAELLDESEITRRLAGVPRWRREGAELVHEVKFKAYLDGPAFASRVAEVAEKMNHHPDIYIGWRKVTLKISTHSKGGLTALDFDLARKIDALGS